LFHGRDQFQQPSAFSRVSLAQKQLILPKLHSQFPIFDHFPENFFNVAKRHVSVVLILVVRAESQDELARRRGHRAPFPFLRLLERLDVIARIAKTIFQKQSHVFERNRGRRAGVLVLLARVDVETPRSRELNRRRRRHESTSRIIGGRGTRRRQSPRVSLEYIYITRNNKF